MMVNTFTEEVLPIVKRLDCYFGNFGTFVSKRVPTKRSILAAFGFDEEASGYHGAAHIGLFNYLKIVTTPIQKKVHYVHSMNQLLQNLIIRTIQLCWKFCTIKIQKESIKRLAGAIQVDTQVFDKQPAVDDAPSMGKIC